MTPQKEDITWRQAFIRITIASCFMLVASNLLVFYALEEVHIEELNKERERIEHIVKSVSELEAFAMDMYTYQESYFYPDDIYRKLQEEGMPDSLAYMFTQVAIKEAGYGLNSQYASQYHNYWGRRDTSNHRNFMRFESNESAIKYMAEKYSNCPKKDKYKWLEEDLNWCPGKGSCKNYYAKVKNINF